MLWPLSVAVDLSREARKCGPQGVLEVFLARVVIIDDSLLIRRLLREILTEATLSVPLYVKDHRWGVVTLGWNPTAFSLS